MRRNIVKKTTESKYEEPECMVAMCGDCVGR